MKADDDYPGFDYKSSQLIKFISASDFVTMLLDDGLVIHYWPRDKESFIKWLEKNDIEDIGNKS